MRFGNMTEKPNWQVRMEALEAKRETTAAGVDETPQALPCIKCGAASAESPCPRCGRYKW